MNSMKAGGRVDLHNHTTASDGLLSPRKLVEYGAIKGLQGLAVTDHDTTDGLEGGIQAGKDYQVEVVPGIELNTQMNEVEIHILGYFIDWASRDFQLTLTAMRDIRENRAKKMVQRLIELYGFPITYEEVQDQAKEGAFGRPHIARVLISKGIVKNVNEAFKRYIGVDCPAYVPRYRLSPKEGIELIQSVGGVSVLAHPGLLTDPNIMDQLLCLEFAGIEVYHSKHTQEQELYYSDLADRHGLIQTGGSDCHGEIFDGMPTIGDVSVSMDVLYSLREKAR